ncbi:MAG: AraC family transcriptional regulator N-terminal domain-containing protein, partial [Acidobacteriota bacterium]
MKSLLDEILEASAHLENAADSALQSAASAEGLGLYRCWRPQKIRDITLPEASVLLVLRGRKHLATTSRSWEAGPGEMLVVPAGTNFWLGNYPDDSGQHYRGIAMRFSDEVISDFRQLYGRELGGGGRHDRWLAEAPLELLHALNQWLVWCGQRPPDSFIARHRRVELLLLLAQAGFAGNLLLPQHPSWSRRITGLFHLDPAHPWRMADVASRLGASESTLRRHLHDEGQVRIDEIACPKNDGLHAALGVVAFHR